MMPFELMKKVMMTGIGLALQTPSEIQSISKEIVKRSKMSEAEGKKFVADLTKKYDKAKKDMEKKIRTGISEYMAGADIASKKELDALKNEIKNLKKARKK
jgi:polyhydroxyalkanoate synthesis regulator phasin